MIEYHYEAGFELGTESQYTDWVSRIIDMEEKRLGVLCYIFCDDDYLLGLNQTYLSHDTLTDIITFDYSEGELLAGDIFISVDRVKENAEDYKQGYHDELLRVMAHGVLHLAGYKDKEDSERRIMRSKENEYIELFHVEH